MKVLNTLKSRAKRRVFVLNSLKVCVLRNARSSEFQFPSDGVCMYENASVLFVLIIIHDHSTLIRILPLMTQK